MTFVVVGCDLEWYDLDIEEQELTAVGARLVRAHTPTEEAVIAAARDADALIIEVAPIGARAIAAFTRCQVVVEAGVGVDSIDVGAATARGIAVANVPDYCVEEVSDQAIASALALGRRLFPYDALVRRGEWGFEGGRPVFRLAGQTVGVVGLGRIGRATARKARGLGMRVVAHDPYLSDEQVRAAGAEPMALEELLRACDFLVCHAPLTPATERLFTAERLALLKPTAYVVNVSRGRLFDEEALAAMLREGRLAGAAIDVFGVEPPPSDHPLRRAPNVILSPHVGWYSEESVVELRRRSARQAAQTLAGQWPEHLVNPAVRSLRERPGPPLSPRG